MAKQCAISTHSLSDILHQHGSSLVGSVLWSIPSDRQVAFDVPWHHYKNQSSIYGTYLDNPDSTFHRSIPWLGKVHLQPRGVLLRAGMGCAEWFSKRKHDRFTDRDVYCAIRGHCIPERVCVQGGAKADKRHWKPSGWNWKPSAARDHIEEAERPQGSCRCHHHHLCVRAVLSPRLARGHLPSVRSRNRCPGRGNSRHKLYFLRQHPV